MIQQSLTHQYSTQLHHMRIAVLGIYPPPLGGVSVHIQRVIHLLQQQQNQVYFFTTEVRWRYKLFPLYLLYFLVWLLWYRPSVVMYHSIYLSNSMIEMRMLAWIQKWLCYQLFLIEHDCRHMYTRNDQWKKQYNTILVSTDRLVLIGTRTYASYQDAGIKMLREYTIESAFLPPDCTREQIILHTYPATLFSFLSTHRPIIAVNAFSCILLNGIDLYGLNMSIALIHHCISLYPNSGLILVLGSGGSAYYYTLLATIQTLNIADHVFILEGQKELWPLLKKVDLFVRPTWSDGASVSVEEAVFFGIPVVASDVCWRPHQVVVFKTGDQQDFVDKVCSVLEKRIQNANKYNYMHAQ